MLMQLLSTVPQNSLTRGGAEAHEPSIAATPRTGYGIIAGDQLQQQLQTGQTCQWPPYGQCVAHLVQFAKMKVQKLPGQKDIVSPVVHHHHHHHHRIRLLEVVIRNQ